MGPNSPAYSAGRATYDLRRLIRKGLIYRAPGTHRYLVTPYGWKLARLYARLEARIFRPALVAIEPNGIADPHPQLSRALAKVDQHLDALILDTFPPKRRAA